MRTLVVIVLLLAVFGASTQCVADCLTQTSAPPCHQHSQGKNSGSEPCKLIQPVGDAQVLGTAPTAAQTPSLASIALQLLPCEPAPADYAQAAAGVLRL